LLEFQGDAKKIIISAALKTKSKAESWAFKAISARAKAIKNWPRGLRTKIVAAGRL